MKSVWKHVLVPLAAVLITSSGALAGGTGGGGSVNPDAIKFNHGPCDWSDDFYQGNPAAGTLPDGFPQQPGNGISVTATTLNSPAAARFGTFRQFGPPATGHQANWVVDESCSDNNPNTRNVRILATTGGYPDLGVNFGETQVEGSSTEFISIIAFLTNQNFFQGNPNARNILPIDIMANFEAYAALKQTLPNGTFATQPCGSMQQTESPPLPGNAGNGNANRPCFPVTSVATPQIRQDWRFATNRNAIDGSVNNDPFNILGIATGTPTPPPGLPFNPVTIPGTGGATATGTSNAPFGYFCDDVIGVWIVTYFWLPINPHTVTPGSACANAYAAMIAANGASLDGSPIMKSGDDLNGLEAVTQDIGPQAGFPCAQEGKLDPAGGDGGAIWIVCPTILDVRNGAITPDAFLDQVKLPNGQPLDPAFNANFNCLQTQGQFPQILPAGSATPPGATVTHSTLSNGTPVVVACSPPTGDL